MPADGTHNLKPCKKGETHNPNGRPKKLTNEIADIPSDAQKKVYATLWAALSSPSKDAIAAVLKKGEAELPEYGYLYQLASKELLGKNGWKTATDICNRLFGMPKNVVQATGDAMTIIVHNPEDKKKVEELGELGI